MSSEIKKQEPRSAFDRAVDERLSVIQASELRAAELQAQQEREALESARSRMLPVLDRLTELVEGERLIARLGPAPSWIEEYCPLTISIIHQGSQTTLGRIIVRDYPIASTSTDESSNFARAYFFDIAILEWEEELLFPYDFELEDLPSYHLELDPFLDLLFDRLVELTTQVERRTNR